MSGAAQNLRLTDAKNDRAKGSEISEILLYGIMKHHYKALPVVPKIFYKQNANDFAKGADSVHIVIENDTEFSLWHGESKFYRNIGGTFLDKIADSVKESLNKKKIKRENLIITNVGDLDVIPNISSEMIQRIKLFLSSENSVDDIKPILNIPILLLHECGITQGASELTDAYRKELREYYSKKATEYFSKQIDKCGSVHMYSSIKFHLILFPVPDKTRVVDTFIKTAKIHRDE